MEGPAADVNDIISRALARPLTLRNEAARRETTAYGASNLPNPSGLPPYTETLLGEEHGLTNDEAYDSTSMLTSQAGHPVLLQGDEFGRASEPFGSESGQTSVESTRFKSRLVVTGNQLSGDVEGVEGLGRGRGSPAAARRWTATTPGAWR